MCHHGLRYVWSSFWHDKILCNPARRSCCRLDFGTVLRFESGYLFPLYGLLMTYLFSRGGTERIHYLLSTVRSDSFRLASVDRGDWNHQISRCVIDISEDFKVDYFLNTYFIWGTGHITQQHLSISWCLQIVFVLISCTWWFCYLHY